jgi:hypothetical protein
MKQLFLLIIPISLFLVACPGSSTIKHVGKPIYLRSIVDADKLGQIENKFERFRQQIMGHFSNKEQYEGVPSMREPAQEFIITPIFGNRPDEFWIYSEFFSPELVEDPVDQRIEQYVRIQRDTFRMEVYYLKNPRDYINEWKKEKPFENLSRKKDLIRDKGCDLLVVPVKGQRYNFASIPHPQITCDMKGNHGATKFMGLHFVLSDEGYNTRFRYYDEDKKMLHETDPRGIEFKRLNHKDKGYTNYTSK